MILCFHDLVIKLWASFHEEHIFNEEESLKIFREGKTEKPLKCLSIELLKEFKWCRLCATARSQIWILIKYWGETSHHIILLTDLSIVRCDQSYLEIRPFLLLHGYSHCATCGKTKESKKDLPLCCYMENTSRIIAVTQVTSFFWSSLRSGNVNIKVLLEFLSQNTSNSGYGSWMKPPVFGTTLVLR